ncbi:MAG: aldose 1-epimerase family protein [Planctomycetaceae bacterium]
MPLHQHTLTDVSRRVWRDEFSIATAELKLAGSDKWSLRRHTLRGGLSAGVDVVELNNGRLALSILPTRGMGVWRGTCDGLDLGWQSPVELPVHPAFVNTLDRNGLGWLTGFNEWICRCGLDLNGPPGPEGTLHGRIANIPAHVVEVAVDTDGPGTISVTGLVDEAMVFGPNLRLRSTVTTIAGSNRFTIIDEITNRRATPGELELLYHINTGRPFLETGARCVAPALEVAPRDRRATEGIDDYATYGPQEPGYAEQVFYFDLAADQQGHTLALLRNARGDKGLSLHFTKQDFPCFALWKCLQPDADGYVTGLEPATNFPNVKSFEREQKRVITLPPGATRTTRLELAVHSSTTQVAEIERQIADLQRGHDPQVHKNPRPGWSPA